MTKPATLRRRSGAGWAPATDESARQRRDRMAKKNLMYLLTPDGGAHFIGECEHLPSDPNHGLPMWFFEIDLMRRDYPWTTSFMVDEEADLVEWVPAMGPAPIWRASWSSVQHGTHMIEAWQAWCEETF